MRTIALVFLFTALLGVAATAQTQPNFSGTWKQDNSRSTVAPGSKLEYSNSIEHTDPKLVVTTRLAGGDRPPSTYSRNYTTDGKPSISSDREGDQISTVVKWDGAALLFETGEKEKSGSLLTRETWTLSADGKTLTKKIHRSGPRGESDQTFVLEKQ